MAKLLATAHIQIGFTRYKPGDFLPDTDTSVPDWLEAGTAVWVPDDYTASTGTKAKLATAEPGLPGIAAGGEMTGDDLVGQVPQTHERRRTKCRP